MRSSLNISEKRKTAFVNLISADEGIWEALYQGIAKATPTLGPTEFSEQLADTVSLPKDDLQEIIRLLFWFYYHYHHERKPIEVVVKEVVDKLRELEDEILQKITNDKWEAFTQFLKNILGLHNTLGISAKSIPVKANHQRLFSCAHIFSDIRTIFNSSDLNSQPKAGIITHDLNIVYYEYDERKDFFISLDIDDIECLHEITERARKKHSTLTRLLKESNIRLLS